MKQLDPPKLTIAVAAAMFLAAAAVGQVSPETSPPPVAKPSQFKNLKIFPAGIPRDALIGVMRGYTVALGGKCTHCHVGEEGKRETMDFASDNKQAKLTTRIMMAMDRRLNEQDFAVKDYTKLKVTCYTCHRGVVKPLTAPPGPLAAS